MDPKPWVPFRRHYSKKLGIEVRTTTAQNSGQRVDARPVSARRFPLSLALAPGGGGGGGGGRPVKVDGRTIWKRNISA